MKEYLLVWPRISCLTSLALTTLYHILLGSKVGSSTFSVPETLLVLYRLNPHIA